MVKFEGPGFTLTGKSIGEQTLWPQSTGKPLKLSTGETGETFTQRFLYGRTRHGTMSITFKCLVKVEIRNRVCVRLVVASSYLQ